MKKIIIAVGVLVIIIIAAVFFLVGNLDTIIKKGVETAGPKILKAPVTLDDVEISVSSGTGELKGLTIGNPSGYKTDYAFKLGGIAIDLDVKSVTTDKVHIRSIIIKGPQINFEGALGKKNNLSQLQANAAGFSGTDKGEDKDSGPSGDRDSGAGKKVQIDLIRIEDGKINAVMDLIKEEKSIEVALPAVELHDIGKNKDATMADAMKLILSSLNKAAMPAVQKAVNDYAKGAGRKAVEDEIKKGADKLKGLLNN